ncbi:dienelactone hydrolase family protein [Arenibaculum pallidiluteum]|uniref:dienelactone hydrolase family protein n=1 Tax=Arenibaculum pallidiluteum TaxID=2812559 RepID=UPI001A969F37|nr:dienelactone hydrolase family protein [Arenibaculum pallidiluteum]
MGTRIELTAADGHRLSAYRADPGGQPRGLVVVAQEIFGVNSHIRGVCDRFAEEGWTAVAPALFDRAERAVELGYQQPDIQRGLELRSRIELDQALADIAAARAVEPGLKAAVVGYCWGGLLAWATATRLDGFSAAVSYYGGGIAKLADETPRCPVMLHFGEQDHAIPLTDVESLRRAHPDLPVHLYAAGHGFNCDQRGSYDRDAAETALRRTLDFLGTHLG